MTNVGTGTGSLLLLYFMCLRDVLAQVCLCHDVGPPLNTCPTAVLNSVQIVTTRASVMVRLATKDCPASIYLLQEHHMRNLHVSRQLLESTHRRHVRMDAAGDLRQHT